MTDAAVSGLAMTLIPPPTLLDTGGDPPAIPSHHKFDSDKLVSLYNDVQWEEFVLEWATSLQPKYEKVMRNGGANDHGVDVAGFASSQGFDGDWDCYQCKNYANTLKPNDAYPEILKIVLGSIAGHYTWPSKYRFVAPKGYGVSLNNLINSPSKLKTEFLKELSKDKSVLSRKMSAATLQSSIEYIKNADFSVFGTVELKELVAQHATTRWHSARFGVTLPARGNAVAPTAKPEEHEQRYIEKLMDAYNERHVGDSINPSNAEGNPKVGAHYTRQRVSFYSAESLRVFARDSVPTHTFRHLQEEIYDGVIDTHDEEHSDGLYRLSSVAKTAHGLAITANLLMPVVNVRDRTGICHQLANDDRLTWCNKNVE